MKTELMNENTVMINGSTWNITQPILDNIGTDGEVAFYSTATHNDENGNTTEIQIYWHTETGEWDDVDEDNFYVRGSDQFYIDQVTGTEAE